MARRFTLGDLVLRAKQRVDMEGQGLIGTTEWKGLISTQYAELYSVVAETGLRYFETVAAIATTGLTASYQEPADHMATVAVDRIVNAQGERRELQELMAQERNRFAGLRGDAVAFAHVDDQIILYPLPPAGQTYQIVYVPQPPDLTAYEDATLIDLVTPDGEAFLLWGVAVMALAKEESDTATARGERDAARERIYTWAVMRSINNPRRQMTMDGTGYVDPADYMSGGSW